MEEGDTGKVENTGSEGEMQYETILNYHPSSITLTIKYLKTAKYMAHTTS